MKKFVITGLLFLMIKPISAQTDSLSLMECLSVARQYAAVNNQWEVYAEIAKLKISNANATYLPGISAYGKAWYQSDAITVMGQNGPVLEVNPFQYNAGIEADQKLYDQVQFDFSSKYSIRYEFQKGVLHVIQTNGYPTLQEIIDESS